MSVIEDAMNGYVRARIDDDVRNAAAAVLEDVGLNVSDVIRVVLTRIAKEKAIPIGLFVPNATTIAAMSEARELMRKTPRFKDAQEMIRALKDETGEEAEDQTSARGGVHKPVRQRLGKAGALR